MNIKPIKQIKKVQAKTVNFILSAIIIACGINFIVSGIIDYSDNKQGWIYIIVGSVLVFLTILVLCIRQLLQSRSITTIQGVVTYDKEKKELIEIKGYSFSEQLKKYLDAACIESRDIKSVWNKDYLGFNRIANADKGNFKVSLTQSSILLNQLIEYILLEELSKITVDHFNTQNFSKKKVNKINKIDVPNLVANNAFLSLFSKSMSEREAFNNREEPNVVLAYSHNGALFEKFELSLPKKCKIIKNSAKVIEIRHPLFRLKIIPAFTGFNALLPNNFEKYYLHSSIHNIYNYNVKIDVELKLSWKAFFIRKSEYFEWIDKYIERLASHMSFQYFIDSIHWNIVETIMECNSKEQVK